MIITTREPSVKKYTNPSITFKPKVINLKKRNADKVLAEIDIKLKAGDYSGINPLEVIYLPLYGSDSGKTTAELLDTAIKLAPQVTQDKPKQQKLHDLMILLAGSFIDGEELNKILEANMINLENNSAVRVLEDRGRNRRDIEIAINMLRRGRSHQEISEDTGLSLERVTELSEGLLVDA